MQRTARSGTNRRCFSPVTKTWSSWRESSSIASTEPRSPRLLFQVADVESSVARSRPKGSFARWPGILRWKRSWSAAGREFEARLATRAARRGCGPLGSASSSKRCGWSTPIRRARWCRPTATFRRPSPTPSAASTRRAADASQRHWSALADAEAIRDAARTRADRLVNRTTGEKAAFLARASSHAAAPALTEFRLLWDTLATVLPGRSKLILDRNAGGRRHVWLADPALLSPAFRPCFGAGVHRTPNAEEPDD